MHGVKDTDMHAPKYKSQLFIHRNQTVGGGKEASKWL